MITLKLPVNGSSFPWDRLRRVIIWTMMYETWVLISLHPLDLIQGRNGVITIFMLLFQDSNEKSFHLPMGADGVQVLALSSHGVTRVKNLIGYLLQNFKIGIFLAIISGESFKLADLFMNARKCNRMEDRNIFMGLGLETQSPFQSSTTISPTTMHTLSGHFAPIRKKQDEVIEPQ